MKIFRKIVAFAIAVCILSGNMVFSQPAYQNAFDENVIAKLSALGIWLEDNELDAMVTKAEFTEFVARMLGMGGQQTILGEQSFDDVSLEHPFYTSIETLYKMGIISREEDKKFSPDRPITYAESAKMLVSALGYAPYAEANGGYPAGYLIVGRQYKIIPRDDNKTLNSVITFADAANMLSYAIEAELLERTAYGDKEKYGRDGDNTILSKYHDIYIVEGIVNAVGDTGINPGTKLKNNQVDISGRIFDSGYMDLKEFTGYSVKAYYKKQSNYHEDMILYVEENKLRNEVLLLNYDSVEYFDEDKRMLYYYEDPSDRTLSNVIIPGSVKIIINDSAANGLTKEDLENADNITLIDNNGDGEIDVVKIENEEIIFVSSFDLSAKKIYYQKQEDIHTLELSLPDEAILVTDKMGNPTELDGITESSVLAVLRDKENKKMKIIVTDKQISGTVQEVENTGDFREMKITIDGTVYNLSKNSYDIKGLEKLEVGKYYTFYLDHKDRVAGIELEVESREQYGYLVKFAQKSGVDRRIEFQILTTKEGFKVYNSAKKMEIDGKKVDDADIIITELDNAAEILNEEMKILDDKYRQYHQRKNRKKGDVYYFRHPVRYKLNLDGELIYLDTPYKRPNVEDDYNIYNSPFGNETLTLYKDFVERQGNSIKPGATFLRNPVMFASDRCPVALDNQTIVFVVPQSNVVDSYDPEIGSNYRDDPAPYMDEPSNYTVTNLSYFSDWKKYPEDVNDESKSKRLEAYDLSTARVARLMVYYVEAGEGLPIQDDTPLTVIDRITQTIDKDGKVVRKLYGYQQGSTIEVNLAEEFQITKYYNHPEGGEVPSTIRRGDIIRYSVNAKNEAVSYEKVFSLRDEDDPNIVRTGNEVSSTVENDLPTLLAVSTDRYIENGHKTAKIYKGTDTITAPYRVVFGTLIIKNGSNLVIRVEDENETFTQLCEARQFNIVMIDEERDRIYIPNIEELVAEKNASSESASKLIVHTAKGSQKSIIVVTRKN